MNYDKANNDNNDNNSNNQVIKNNTRLDVCIVIN